MDYKKWEKALGNIFSSFGFNKIEKIYTFEGDQVIIFVSFQREAVIKQWFINVGFWLLPLEGVIPRKVEHTHLYFRLERIFPEQRELILAGGDWSNSDIELHFNKLLRCLETDICPRLAALGNLQNLKRAFDASLNERGLIRGEAREFLGKVLR